MVSVLGFELFRISVTLLLQALFIALLVWGYFVYRRKQKYEWGRTVPPMPAPSLLLGNAAVMSGDEAANKVLALHRSLGNVFRLSLGPTVINNYMWFFNDPALISELQNDNADAIKEMPSRILGMFQAFGDRCIMSLAGPDWWAHKTACAPWHTAKNIGIAQTHIYDAIDSLVTRVIPALKGSAVNLNLITTRLLVDATARAAWHEEISQTEDSDLLAAVMGCFAEQTRRASVPLPIMWAVWTPASWQKSLKVVRATAAAKLYAAKDSNVEGDYLSHMARVVREGKLDFFNAAEEVNTLIFGSVGTRYVLACALYWISKDTKLQSEIRAQVAPLFAKSARPSFDDIASQPLLNAVAHEAMRYLPPGWVASRMASRDIELAGGKYLVPKGTNVVVCLLGLHRNGAVHPEPDTFNVDRFLSADRKTFKPMPYPDDFETNIMVRHPVYLPFSLGARLCPGLLFALQVVRIAVAVLVHKFDILPVPEGDATLAFTDIIYLKSPLARFSPRL